jgi:hypothetical protein
MTSDHFLTRVYLILPMSLISYLFYQIHGQRRRDSNCQEGISPHQGQYSTSAKHQTVILNSQANPADLKPTSAYKTVSSGQESSPAETQFTNPEIRPPPKSSLPSHQSSSPLNRSLSSNKKEQTYSGLLELGITGSDLHQS